MCAPDTVDGKLAWLIRASWEADQCKPRPTPATRHPQWTSNRTVLDTVLPAAETKAAAVQWLSFALSLRLVWQADTVTGLPHVYVDGSGCLHALVVHHPHCSYRALKGALVLAVATTSTLALQDLSAAMCDVWLQRALALAPELLISVDLGDHYCENIVAHAPQKVWALTRACRWGDLRAAWVTAAVASR